MRSGATAARVEPTAIGQLGAAIESALKAAPVADVLSVLTGAFVSLTVEVVRRQGHDATLPITVNGGSNRDITIHPPKPPAPARGDATSGKTPTAPKDASP